MDRIHTKFILTIDEDIVVDRDKVTAKIKALSLDKSEQKHIFEFGEKPELSDYDDIVDKAIDKLNYNSYADKCLYVQEWFMIEESEEDKSSDPSSILYKMKVSLLQLKKHHSLFLNLSFNAWKEIITSMPLIVLEDSQLLYKEGEEISAAYLVIMGKIVMHSKKLGAIGLVKIGDVIGEEWLVKTHKGKEHLESAYSNGLTFVMELTPEYWESLKNVLSWLNLRTDYFKISRMIDNWYVKKKGWRQYKVKINS